MILSTHAIVGASVASFVPENPFLAFILAFISHFLLDAIPHWDYKLYSIEHKNGDKMQTNMHFNKAFLFDLARISFDAFIGLTITLIAFQDSLAFPYVVLIGSIGGMMPDALQFLYFKWKQEPLRTLQIFHMWIHAKKRINHPVWGIAFQVILVFASLVFSL